MQYRQLDSNGDYIIGLPFLANSSACVAQAVSTRMKLWQGEWFLDTTDGTPWLQSIMGRQQISPDIYIKNRILGTPNVTSIVAYSGVYDPVKRAYSVTASINTAYGQTTVSATL